MKRTLIAASAALAALIASPGAAEMDTKNWHIGFIDAEGNSTDLRGAYHEVAYARGSRKFVLEVMCGPNSGNRIFRIARRLAGDEKFSGDTFVAAITVRTGDKIEFSQDARDLTYNEEGKYYQGRLAKKLGDALKRGNRLVFEDPDRPNFRTVFTLNGSSKTIDQINCE